MCRGRQGVVEHNISVLLISIHSLYVEGDRVFEFGPVRPVHISIHSLYVEGDGDSYRGAQVVISDFNPLPLCRGRPPK